MVLHVLCPTHELEENGEAIAVGDHISRAATWSDNAYYGSELDSISWGFDIDAEASGRAATTISGQVIAISAIYVRLTQTAGKGWTARPGSAHLEPVDSTVATRHIRPAIDWDSISTPDEQGHVYSAGYPRVEEGDEHLSGWVITLERAQINPPTDAA